MPLTPGDRFAGHFEVTGVLGAGGMGEVYRARDTRLNRDVALKLLRDVFAADADRLARFQREAELLASLNHPNIAQIYGIEEDGGVRALVLELVEGPTLKARIARGPMPPDEVLAIATQLADGLEAAHEAGVVHRDLKPANVKVQRDGTVKVLDFGLGKALEAAAPGDPRDPSTWSSADTGVGVIVGTAAYMSPEQARGRAVDRRTDIWAFGAVLFEMLTGRRAFEGDDAPGIFAEVLKTEPAWETLPGDVTAAVSAVLRRCLEKEPFQRMRDIADVRMGLHGAFDYAGRPAVDARRASGWGRRALELVGAAAVAGLGVWLLQPSAPREPVRFAIAGAPGMGPFVELSPDGRHLAYLEGDETGRSRIRLHSLASGEARQVSDTARAGTPLFWSPDSRFVGFGDGRTLRRVDAATGVVEPVCDTLVFNGGAWNGDDVILFGGRSGIMQVAAGGGTPAALTTVDAARGEITHAAPWFLPDGRHFLYLRASLDSSTGGIYVGALGVEPAEQDPTRLLATERPAVYGRSRGSTTGHLFFMQGSRLLAQPFDDARRELAGEPTVVAEEVGSYDVRWEVVLGVPNWESSPGGTPRRATPCVGSILLVRRGRPSAFGGLDDPRHPRLSPDGNRLALVEAGDVWVFQLDDDRPPIRLTFDESSDAIGSPLWTPDGAGIVYEGDGSLYRVSADGGSPPEPIGPAGHYHAHAWSPEGDLIAVAISGESGDLVEFSPSSEAEPRVVVQTAASEGAAAALSPDGRWLAYTSDATGRREIWVRRYPGPGAPVRVSHDGGAEPVWTGDGGTLYYLNGRSMMAVAVETSTGFEFAAPVRAFDGDFRIYERPPSYDVTADGRFVTTRSDTDPSISVLLNWPEALRSRSNNP